MSARFAVALAVRSLVRGGQRTVLAAVCVAFGVMSLVALELLSTMIATSILVDARTIVGGDASLSRTAGALTADDIAHIERLRSSGEISAYTCIADMGGGMLKTSRSGRVHILSRALGVDPVTYPTAGAIRLRGEQQDGFAAAIARPGTAVLSRDLADRMGLAAGDEFSLGGGALGPPARLTVGAVADMTPDRHGDTLYVSLDTARAIAGRADVVTEASVLSADTGRLAALEESGWTVRLPDQVAQQRARVVDLFGLLLKGSGVLGLLLGGVGVSNTLQVLLARRKLEIATLKSIGYDRRHLVALFGLETALLGLAGSIAGAVAGVALSAWLRDLLGRAGPFLLEQAFDPGIVASGVAVGTATAVVFGLHAIARASAVRPATLLRDLPTPPRWLESIALGALLVVLFAGIASVVLGSAAKGIGVAVAGFVGLSLLAGALGLVFFGVVSLPLRLPGLLAIARNNLRRQPARVIVALVALFCGVFTIGFSAAVLSAARQQFERRALPEDGVNLLVLVPSGEASDARAVLRDAGVTRVEQMVTSAVVVRTAAGDVVSGLDAVSGTTAEASDAVRIVDGTWSSAAGRALAPARNGRPVGGVSIGDSLAIEGAEGRAATVVIEGVYEPVMSSQLAPRPDGLIVDTETAEQLGGASARVRLAGRVDVDRLPSTADRVGRALPQAMVIDRSALNSALQGVLEGLFAFVAAVAGLALVAGSVLIANSAGLAMLERRREMGIFKAIGYSSGRVLAGIAAEYTLLGLIAGIVGVAAVALALEAINRYQHSTRIDLEPPVAVAMIVVVTAIALASAIVVAWRPVRARPLDVLRQE